MTTLEFAVSRLARVLDLEALFRPIPLSAKLCLDFATSSRVLLSIANKCLFNKSRDLSKTREMKCSKLRDALDNKGF